MRPHLLAGAAEADPSPDLSPDLSPDIVICPDGPLLITGAHVVEDVDGRRHRTTRPVSAVCRCGRSGRAPWCDGTHKLVRDDTRA